jgi:PilZ domain
MNTQAVKQEQRSMRRFAMQLPVEVKNGAADVIATTRDVSAKGIFLFLDHDIAADSPIEFTLTLPPEVTMTQSMRVKCSGTVVRVERDHRGKFGVAALVHHYRFLDSNDV